MSNTNRKSYLSFSEAQEQNSILKQIVYCIDFALKNFDISNYQENINHIKLIENFRYHYNEVNIDLNSKKNKSEFNEETQHPEKMILRNPDNDRELPLNTVIINDFNREHNKDVDKAIIHLGLCADEYAKSFRAMAFTIANHIYFRKNAYKPETEEGRKLIAHELTHVAQNKLQNENRNATKEELEQEAEKEELKEQHDSEKYVTLSAGRKTYRVTEKVAKKIEYYAEQELEEWIKREVEYMPEDKALKLLLNYQEYLRCKRLGIEYK